MTLGDSPQHVHPTLFHRFITPVDDSDTFDTTLSATDDEIPLVDMPRQRSSESSITDLLLPHAPKTKHASKWRLFISICLLEICLSNQFSVVIAAANDLVAGRAPTGIVLVAYCIPSLVLRVYVSLWGLPELNIPTLWSYARGSKARELEREVSAAGVEREINYGERLLLSVLCCGFGAQLLAWMENIPVRVMGVALMSLSSNLGDMCVSPATQTRDDERWGADAVENRSMIMMCSRYPKSAKYAFGGYSMGTGLSNVVGSALYMFATSVAMMDPRAVIALVLIGPLLALLGYHFFLPTPESGKRRRKHGETGAGVMALPVNKKLRIVRQLVMPYMLPLASCFFLENVVNQGVLPTLTFPLPFTSTPTLLAPLWNKIFHTPRDFYPVYITINSLFSLLGRSTITLFRLRDGESRSIMLFGVLIAVEGVILLLQVVNSVNLSAAITDGGELGLYTSGPGGVVGLIAVMGFVLGLVFCNIYWDLGNKPLPEGVYTALRRGQRGQGEGVLGNGEGEELEGKLGREEEMELREFLLGTVAPGDTVAIMVAGVVAMWVQGVLRGLRENE
ncbi:hypothetical protein EX30DRAFT_398282 [Ascodesmis nigricans]|uniref:Protein BTN n=1 Tax=Ascodesmis nigricans TaxID=341454 RepID=A0A4S2MRN5_9PEZI|nr:hypothetical protein EX30DRAFT_398282 [Ascodesmis nigricans]